MSKSKTSVPDAWDDDWETLADKQAAEPPSPPKPEVKLSKAERKAKHAETNRQLWEDAETVKEQPMFLQQSRNEPAYKTEFKPAMKVLARKPPPKVASRTDAADGVSKLNLDDDDDSEEEHRKKAAADYEERKARAIREREEKERRYQEVRAKLFGTEDSNSRPSSATPNNESGSKNSSRGKGRGGKQNNPRGSGSNDQSPARPGTQRKQLYDPNYTEKPTSAYIQRRAAGDSGRSTPVEERPIRAPRGPDSSGKAGFGFSLATGKGSDAT